jgi:hypothetical protein
MDTVPLKRSTGRDVEITNDLVDVDPTCDIAAFCVLIFDLLRPPFRNTLKRRGDRKAFRQKSAQVCETITGQLGNVPGRYGLGQRSSTPCPHTLRELHHRYCSIHLGVDHRHNTIHSSPCHV